MVKPINKLYQTGPGREPKATKKVRVKLGFRKKGNRIP